MNPAGVLPGTVSVGVIGTGAIVTAAHLPVLANLPDVRIAWIADRNRQSANRLARCYRTEGFGNEILEKTPPSDVVLFAIPYGVRKPYYERFAASTCAWYLEKPFALTTAEHLELCGRKADHLIAGGLQRRASGIVQLARSVVRDGVFGTLRRVDVGLGYRGRIVGGNSHTGNAQVAGGGIVAELGVHCIDAIAYCVDPVAVSVRRCRMIVDEGLDIHTEAELELTTAGGAQAEMTLTMSNLVDTSEEVAFEFEHASVRFSVFTDEPLRVHARTSGAQYVLADRVAGYPRTKDQVFHRFWSAFLHAARSGQPNFTSARGMLMTTRIVEAIYASGRAGG